MEWIILPNLVVSDVCFGDPPLQPLSRYFLPTRYLSRDLDEANFPPLPDFSSRIMSLWLYALERCALFGSRAKGAANDKYWVLDCCR